MCGIAGLIAKRRVDAATITAMTDAIRSRGPDDAGLWLSEDGRVGLGQRRLAIIDLSPGGHQPKISASGRYVIDFNGEIYNYRDLRSELVAAGAGIIWQSQSDTEVLVEAIAYWGLETALNKTAGMFALALWDRKEKVLYLARDRFGEKPLYYGDTGEGVAFASELKALRTLPGFDSTVDPVSLRHMLAVGYVPVGQSIYRAVRQLSPGCLVELKQGVAARDVQERCWYDYANVVAQGAADPITNRPEALAQLESVMAQAVSRQLVADVPVGAFLSGGIDSSLVTAFATRQAGARIKTFSIGFDIAAYDESTFAHRVAVHLGTDHHSLRVTAPQARDVIPKLAQIYDEPFGDSSQIPTYLVSQFAREHVSVALTGDAGDEVFGGYNRHRMFPELWRQASRLPKRLRASGLGLLSNVSPSVWNAVLGQGRPPQFGHKVKRGLKITAGSTSLGDIYANFLDEWYGLPSPVAAFDKQSGPQLSAPSGLPYATQVMLADALSYLPGDILTKVDRAAMAVSLESRVPFLDPAVVELAARIPEHFKFSGGNGKSILRELLYTLVPQALVDRPKAGFAVPVGEWIKGPLRDWAESLLSKEALMAEGLLDSDPIRKRWERHLAGREDATQALWAVLMYQAWRQQV